MSSRRSTLAHVFLALLLLLAQQQAIVHALGHDFQRIHASVNDVTDHGAAVCAKCFAFTNLDHAESGRLFDVGLASFSLPVLPAGAWASAEFFSFHPYLSRAPPIFS